MGFAEGIEEAAGASEGMPVPLPVASTACCLLCLPQPCILKISKAPGGTPECTAAGGMLYRAQEPGAQGSAN